MFKAGHQYTVYVTLIGKEGYTFLASSTAKVNGQSAKTVMWTDVQFLVQFTFPVLEGNPDDIISLVSVNLDAPVIGAKPDYTAELPSGSNYFLAEFNTNYFRHDIGWLDDTTNSYVDTENGIFKSGRTYIVYIYLTAKEGYYFSSNTTAKVNGQAAAVSLSEGQLKIEYTFPALEGDITDLISSVSISLDAPVVGAKPDYTAEFPVGANYYSDKKITNSCFRNDIFWRDVTTGYEMDPDNSLFENGHKYNVIIFLSAKEGYSFHNISVTLNGQLAQGFIDEGLLEITYSFSVLGGLNIGDTATVGGNNYTITNNQTDGTGTVTLTGVSDKRATVSVPNTVVINGYVYKVNRIGTKAFYGDKTLKTVSIGSNVTVIDSYAFYGCSNLTKVSGGKVLKSIGSKAFAYCSKLKSFSISSTVLNKISSYSFQKDKKLKTIYIKYTTKLTKSGVKKSLKKSYVKTVKVKKSKVKKYKKYFKKSNSGRSVKVKK